MKTHLLLLYGIHVLIYTLLLYLFRKLIITEDVFQLSFGEQMDDSMIAAVYRMQERYAYLQYALLPLSILFKVVATASCMYLRCFFTQLKVQFSTLLRLALWGEFVFVLMEFCRYFSLHQKSDFLTLEQAQWYTPLSLITLFESNEIAFWYVYPLKSCNLFECAYILILAVLSHKIIGWKKGEALELVILSYGTALFLWVVLVSFLSLNLV